MLPLAFMLLLAAGAAAPPYLNQFQGFTLMPGPLKAPEFKGLDIDTEKPGEKEVSSGVRAAEGAPRRTTPQLCAPLTAKQVDYTLGEDGVFFEDEYGACTSHKRSCARSLL